MTKLSRIDKMVQNLINMTKMIFDAELIVIDEDKNVVASTVESENFNDNTLNELSKYEIAIDKRQLGFIYLDDENIDESNNKKIEGYLKRLIDIITEKYIEKMMELETEKLFFQLNSVLDSIKPGIMVADLQGLITFVNQEFENITGVKKSAIIGQHLNSIFNDSSILKVLQLNEEIWNKEVIFNNESISKRVVVSANPIKKNNKNRGIVITIRGIKDIQKIIDDLYVDIKKPSFDNIIGESKILKNAKDRAQKVVYSSSSVLIRGESGTGKELFARAIHEESKRSKENFVSINCAAIPAELLESELFGYEAGSFTGAKKDGKPGKFEIADKGTIFLDEIGDMPLQLQAKILKFIQDRQFYRIGGVKKIDVDVRIISATNRNLEKLIKDKKFREDLYYRLNVIPLYIPPLRKRGKDILLLVEHFINKFNHKLNKDIDGITGRVKDKLLNYDWPGNVRELENVIEYAINMETTNLLRIDNLPNRLFSSEIKDVSNSDLESEINKVERDLIIKALNKYGRSTKGKLEAAESLGIGKTTLYKKINKYNIE
ncbi:MAG: sigma-54 interaction domain-containing protein [Bacillota bacterium]